MGCGGMDLNEGKLIKKIYNGILFENSNFSDALIKSDEELNKKLRMFIPFRIKKENSDEIINNSKDEILNKIASIDFKKNYIIAINGINKVSSIEKEDNNYVIYHDNQPAKRNLYIALVVKKIEGEPKIIFASPKQFI